MNRNLFSNRQLRSFNGLLRAQIDERNLYINARASLAGTNLAARWVEEDLDDGDAYVFSYAEDKPWFHRCAVMPIYCGVKGEKLGESRDFRDMLLTLFREWGYEATADTSILSRHGFRIHVKFSFPRWHEQDSCADILDDSEIPLFPDLPSNTETCSLGMTGNWFDSNADHFFQESQVESRQKACIYTYLYGQFSRWERSLPDVRQGLTGCTITHFNNEEQPCIDDDFLPIGTYSKESKTFLWVWDNPGWLKSYGLSEDLRSTNPALSQMLFKVSLISDKYGFAEFEGGTELSVEEFESWEFAAMACKELEADSTFMLPGEYGNTYGVLFYRDNQQRHHCQQIIKRLSRWRGIMQTFLHANKQIYESSSLAFAREFLKSEYGAWLEADFVEASSSKIFCDILRLRVAESANEERRFKETIKSLMANSNMHCEI